MSSLRSFRSLLAAPEMIRAVIPEICPSGFHPFIKSFPTVPHTPPHIVWAPDSFCHPAVNNRHGAHPNAKLQPAPKGGRTYTQKNGKKAEIFRRKSRGAAELFRPPGANEIQTDPENCFLWRPDPKIRKSVHQVFILVQRPFQRYLLHLPT